MQTRTTADVIAREIRAEMGRQLKTGSELGKVLHITQRSASFKMRGERAFSWDEAATACIWLGTTLPDLMINAGLGSQKSEAA